MIESILADLINPGLLINRSVTSRPCLRCVEETTLVTCHQQDTIQVSTDDVSSAQSPVP